MSKNLFRTKTKTLFLLRNSVHKPEIIKTRLIFNFLQGPSQKLLITKIHTVYPFIEKSEDLFSFFNFKTNYR